MIHSHRLATRRDLDQIVAIYNATIPSRMVTADSEPVSVASRVSWFYDHQPDSRPLWVCGTDGRITGWLNFSWFYGRPAYNKIAEISVYVEATQRRHGFGTYLVQSAISPASTLKIDKLLGFIFGHNLPSLALFARLGFARWGFLPKVASLDGIERDLVIVERRV